MNYIIPFEKVLKFKNPVKEICSISLEHEITKNDSELLGNFFITGTYKEHELSVNTNDFKFTVPFSLEMTDNIDRNTIDFQIDDFTYELDGDDLHINIDYSVNAKENIIEEREIPKKEVIEPIIEAKDEKDEISSMMFANDYKTYMIYSVKTDDNLELICNNYHITKEDIQTINNIEEISIGDKLIIPINNE